MKTITFTDYLKSKSAQFNEGVNIMVKRLHKQYKNVLKNVEPFCGNCDMVLRCETVMYKVDDSPCSEWRLANTKRYHTKVLKTSYKQKYKLLKKHLCITCLDVYTYDEFNYDYDSDCEYDNCSNCCSREENKHDLRGKFNPKLNKYI